MELILTLRGRKRASQVGGFGAEQQVLYSLRDGALTIDEIVEDTGLPEERVVEVVERLIEERLVERR